MAETSTLDDLHDTSEAEMAARSVVAHIHRCPKGPEPPALFRVLYAALSDQPPLAQIAPERAPESKATFTFFEAQYFDLTEGTEPTVEEVGDIIFRGVITDERLADEHYARGNWRTVVPYVYPTKHFSALNAPSLTVRNC